MADFPAWARLRRAAVVALLAAIALTVVFTDGARGAGSAQGWLGNGTTWPQRSLVVFAPAAVPVSPATLKVSENGSAVKSLTVTPLRQAGAQDFGLVVVLDRGAGMAGAPFGAAVAAVRGLAASRAAGQQLGVVAFGQSPSVVAPIGANSAAIASALTAVPSASSSPTSNVPAAISAALHQLAGAQVAFGAIVVVSNGADHLIGDGAQAASVRAAAAAANVPIFTIGVRDSSTTAANLQRLHAVAPGQLVAAAPAQLSSVLNEIDATVTRGYVARWRSRQRPGTAVDVAARVSGAADAIRGAYSSPVAVHHVTQTPEHPRFSLTHRLSALPSFAVAPVPRPVPAPRTPAASAPASSGGSFWTTPSGALLLAGLVGALVMITVVLLLHRPAKRAVRVRVGSYHADADAEAAEQVTLVSGKRARSGLISRLEHGRWWPPFVLDVDISGSELSPVALLKRGALAGLLLGILLLLVTQSPLLMVVPLLGWPWVLRKLYARKARKMRDKFRDALPTYLQDLASAMRVGRSFVGALTSIAGSADEPLKSAFERAITDEALGRPVEEALDEVADRMGSTDLGQVALIAGLNRRSGSNVAEALDRVAEGARERADLGREIKALTAQAKMSSFVLTALPGVLLLGINIISPLYSHPLFHTTLGIVMLGVGTLMVFMGWKALQKITTVEA